MTALVTGASSGIGLEIARILHDQYHYRVILVARREEKLKKIQTELPNTEIIVMDLSKIDNCISLYEKVKNQDIDILVNSAGVGTFGYFDETLLENEIAMIQINIEAVHVLTKLFLKDFIKKDKGYILNVASSAAFMPGPLMSSYYSTKVYVLYLTEAIWRELKEKKSHVSISAFCPGPVDTEFNKKLDITFSVQSLNPHDAAEYAIKGMVRKKRIIIPETKMKILHFFMRFVPERLLLYINYRIQKSKKKDNP